MDNSGENLYVSFTKYLIDQDNPAEMKTMIDEVEDTLLKSENTRKRIMEIYKGAHSSDSTCKNTDAEILNNHDDISQYLNSKCNLLLPDMEEHYDLDIDETVQKIKAYAEDLNTSYYKSSICSDSFQVQEHSNLDLEEYAHNLSVLNERLSTFNLSKNDKAACKRNPEVDEKLMKLCEDVDLFTKMVKARTQLADCEEKWSSKQASDNDTALIYSQVIENILTKTNEVSYALSNRNKK